MRVLAADTTTAQGSVALIEGESRSARMRIETEFAHAESLLPTIDALLRSEGLTLAGIEGLAVAAGPGSFTGLRIGIATMEGLAFAIGRPIVGVSTLEATAFHYRDASELVAPFQDARRNEVYAALYRKGGAIVLEPRCESPERFCGRLPHETILIAGSGVDPYRGLIEERLGSRARTAAAPPFLAEDVAQVGRRLLIAGNAARLGGLRAVYLRPSDAERTVPS